MITLFKIAKYEKNNDLFVKTGYDEYSITYLKGLKVHQLRIVVNGFLTKEVINLISFKDSYKCKLLSAISEYLRYGKSSNEIVHKKINLEYIKAFYSKQIVHNVQQYLININKEDSRDVLTKFNLIN